MDFFSVVDLILYVLIISQSYRLICKASKDFLENPFLLFGMKIDQANTVFQVTKTSLYAPSTGVEIF